MKKLWIIIPILLASKAIIAQRPLDVTEVRIVAPYEPTISDAFKINDNPTIDDSQEEKPRFTYSIAPRKLETKFQIEPMKPAQVNEPTLAALNHGHLRLGFGTQATPYAELFVNSNRSKTHAVGFNIRHYSTLSSIPGYAYSGFSENKAKLFGTYFFGQNLLNGGIKINHDRLHFYGFDPTIYGFAPHGQTPQAGQTELKKNEYSQKLTRLNAYIGLVNSKNSTSSLTYETGIEYKLFADSYDANENLLSINGKIGHKIDGALGSYHNPVISLDLGGNFFKNSVGINSFSTSVVSMKPGIEYRTNGLLLYAGLDATLVVDTSKTSIGLYPNAIIEVDLIEQYLKVHAKITGSVKQHSLDELTMLNPFLDTAAELKLQNTKYLISGGVKGIFSDNLSYNLSFSGARIQNHPFFVTDFGSQFKNKFFVIYDTLTRIGVKGELFSSFGQKAKARFSASYYQYSLKNELLPWNLPEVELALNTKFNLTDEIVITADLLGRGKTFAKAFDIDNSVIGQKLHDFIIDFNLGGEYKISPTLLAFVQFQNITGKSFERWLNYPTRGLNIFAGVGWSF
jgi:hypothetical protein